MTKDNFYYNSDKLFSYNAIYSFSMGERGNGKTYQGKKRGVKNFQKKGTQMIYVRRTQTEIDNIKNSLFNDIALDMKLNITVKGNQAFIDGKLFCYFIALSTSNKFKSASFPLVDLIFFDEYIITRTGRNNYLKNEMNLLNDLVETVFRTRKPNVYICANAVSYVNPFFTYFKLEPKPSDTFLTIPLVVPKYSLLREVCNKYTGVVLELTNSGEYRQMKSETPFALLLQNTEYGDYAFNNTTLEDNQEFIQSKKPQEFNYFRGAYRINDKIIGCWSWSIHDSGVWFGINKIDKNSNWKYTIYSNENYEGWKNVKIDRLNHNIKYIKSCFLEGKIGYENQEVKKMFVEEVSKYL